MTPVKLTFNVGRLVNAKALVHLVRVRLTHCIACLHKRLLLSQFHIDDADMITLHCWASGQRESISSFYGHRQTTFTSTGWNESGNNIVHHHQQQKKQSTLSVDTGQTHYVTQSVLPKAENLSVILTSWYPPAVRVHWRYNFSQIQNSRLKAFQIMYYPSKSRYRIIQEVPHYFTNLTLDRLQPGVEYNLTVNAMSESGTTNDSRVVQFISPDNETRRGHKKFFNRPIHVYPDEIQEGLQVREDEVVIVVLVIIAWIGCLFVFFNKWGKIRMLEPYQPQYKESFHNSIHSIHPKPSRMNTCTSVPPNMISIESRGSLIPDRDLFLHHSRMTESGQLYQCASGTTYHHPAYRPRLNSVFVGNPYHRDSLYPEQNMPRKVKSAEDLKSLVVQVSQNIPSTSTSVL
ncbi:hypothetical protein RDWZM_007145 [Blomia tropicalis]|uniref:Fibronectin type-III domain-containing protein n=1 Tax=Blomia tropicalis TaxID=40697 RepID=A0A9Q0RMF2_BLOTA|nr:hypothetical protein RDWZM_007145 [Blomia tropicalis]